MNTFCFKLSHSCWSAYVIAQTVHCRIEWVGIGVGKSKALGREGTASAQCRVQNGLTASSGAAGGEGH